MTHNHEDFTGSFSNIRIMYSCVKAQCISMHENAMCPCWHKQLRELGFVFFRSPSVASICSVHLMSLLRPVSTQHPFLSRANAWSPHFLRSPCLPPRMFETSHVKPEKKPAALTSQGTETCVCFFFTQHYIRGDNFWGREFLIVCTSFACIRLKPLNNYPRLFLVWPPLLRPDLD